jgi:hypothetical protein
MLTAVGNVAPVAIGALAAHYPLQVSQSFVYYHYYYSDYHCRQTTLELHQLCCLHRSIIMLSALLSKLLRTTIRFMTPRLTLL